MSLSADRLCPPPRRAIRRSSWLGRRRGWQGAGGGRAGARILLASLALAALMLPGHVAGHALAPVLLEIDPEAEAGAWALHWQFAHADAWALQTRPLPADGCRLERGWTAAQALGGDGPPALVSSALIACSREAGEPAAALAGALLIPGLAQHPATVMVRQHLPAGGERTLLLHGGRDRLVLSAGATDHWLDIAGGYLLLGAQHLLGADHLLFLLGLFLVIRGLRRLLLATLAFTVGHSLTLALATLGWLRLPQEVAEFGIALSLVLLAVQALNRVGGGTEPLASTLRLVLFAAGFGLLHGLGFAGALAEIGLPDGALLTALLAFNLGIEAGQLAVLLSLLLLRAALGRFLVAPSAEVAVAQGVAYAVGAAGVYWCLDRSLGGWLGV